MASTLPAVKNAAYTLYVGLPSQADTKLIKTSVTLAAGDVLISKDGGAFTNITALPVEIGTSGVLACALSATEMNADTVVVLFRDVAGAEWCDYVETIRTAAQTFDGLADAYHDEVIEGALTARQIQRIVLAALAGESTGGGTTAITFRDVADSKARITATVTNVGNRTAITLDGS